MKTGGINVAPVEMEEVLISHPGVQAAFVIGVLDAVQDEMLAAVIIPTPGEHVFHYGLINRAQAAHQPLNVLA